MPGQVAPLRWFGGKNSLADWIISVMPPHEVYVELFGGSAAVLLNKRPSALEVYNDIDADLVGFWRVVRDPESFERLQLRLELTPYSRAEWDWSKRNTADCMDPVERAARWWTRVSQTFSADTTGGWSYDVKPIRGAVSTYLSRIASLERTHQRMRGVQVECSTWQAMLERYDSPSTLFYADPPYVPDTRTRPDHGYACEMQEAEHVELVDRLLAVAGQVVLSGYGHPVYGALDQAGWRRYERNVAAISSPAGRTRRKRLAQTERRVEVLWVKAGEALPLFALHVSDVPFAE